jgi:hypothetical protein
MFTSIDKAIVAFIGALVYLITEFTNLSAEIISPEIIQSAAAIITALLVYFVPNKAPKTKAKNK